MYLGIEQRSVELTQRSKVSFSRATALIGSAAFRSEVQRTDRDIISLEGPLVFRNLFAVDKESAISVLTVVPDGGDHIPCVRHELIRCGAMHAVLIVNDEVQSVRSERLPPSLRKR